MGPGSHVDYPGGVIRHATRLVGADPDGQWLRLRCELADGVVIDHQLNMTVDAIETRVIAH